MRVPLMIKGVSDVVKEHGLNIKRRIREALTENENRKYRRLLDMVKVSYPQWAEETEKRAKDPDAQTPNDGEDYILICASVGKLHSDAKINIESYFMTHPEAQILYGDEDVWPDAGNSGGVGERMLPWFKPDWSPDLLDSFFYFGSVIAMRKEYESLIKEPENLKSAGLCKSSESGIDYAVSSREDFLTWLRRCLMQAGAYEKGNGSVGHVPAVIFHCKDEGEQAKFREWRGASCGGDLKEAAVSVVIPSRDNPEMLEKCVRSCLLAADGVSEEILIIDNGSNGDNREKIEGMIKRLERQDIRLRYLYRPMEFNFSRMCNIGAAKADGRFLLFLNDDVELCEKGCARRMAAMAQRPYTGAVGVKLLYPESGRIQHAGITNLPMGPVHKLQFLDDNECYYYGANRGMRNVTAVTAACLMVEKKKFLDCGGFCEEMPVAFNDVDLCFALHEDGYRNVCLNDTYAYHHESFSRGQDESAEKLERLLGEKETLYKRHPEMKGTDPFYSVYLNRDGLDTRIRPAYVTGGNKIQEVKNTPGKFSMMGYRQDPCALVRIEDVRRGFIGGYGVALGDNNACYEYMLLLGREDKPQDADKADGADKAGSAGGDVLYIRLKGQYRPDLEENMPDQTNVGLSGFAVRFSDGILPEGKYRIGLAVRNRVSRLRLFNWSNRFFEVQNRGRGMEE